MREAYLTGKDLYSTMAAEIYKTTYENCREFYPDGTTNEDGKKRRSATKSILLRDSLWKRNSFCSRTNT